MSLQPGADDRSYADEVRTWSVRGWKDFIEPIIFSDARRRSPPIARPATGLVISASGTHWSVDSERLGIDEILVIETGSDPRRDSGHTLAP